MACPIYTYSNAERARCPIPKKVLRRANPNPRWQLVLGILTSSATRRAKLKESPNEQGHRNDGHISKAMFGSNCPTPGKIHVDRRRRRTAHATLGAGYGRTRFPSDDRRIGV